jgi:hypothetical protein
MQDSTTNVVILDPNTLRVRAAAYHKGSAACFDEARRLRDLGRQFEIWADELEHDSRLTRAAARP